MDISKFNNLKKIPYNWLFIDDPKSLKTNLASAKNLIIAVPDFSFIDKYCPDNFDFSGIIKKDFIEELNIIASQKKIIEDRLAFHLEDYSKGIEQLKSRVDEDLWKKIHLFADEAASNIALHSGKSDGLIEAYFLKNNIVVLSVTDNGGRLVARSLRKALSSLCTSSAENEMNSENIIIGGNGLKLLFHYVTFIKFNVIPFELTQVIGVFIPKMDFSGYIFEDRREEISNGCLFRNN